MAAFLAKRGIWIGFGLITLMLIAGVLAAILAGNRISGAGLLRELSDVTGRRTVFAGEPKISVFPALSVELQGVTLHDWRNSSNNYPVLKVPQMRISLSVWSALQGKLHVTGAVLERPELHAKSESGAWQLPYGSQSRLAKLIAGLNVSQPQDQYEELLREIGENAFGNIQINNGTISFGTASPDLINALNAELKWESGNRNGSFAAFGNWRNEAVSLNLTADDVAMLMAGADTGISAKLESQPLKTQFTGTARLQPSPFIEGSVFGEAASVAAATEWLGLQTKYKVSDLGLILNAALKADSEKWQLEDSQLQWGNNKGSGGLIFQPNTTPPMVSGTLDFEVLDLAMLRQFFGQTSNDDSSALQGLNADLRISAKAASFGALVLNKVAASLQISKLANTLDIHNAAAFGGTLQMAIKSQIQPKREAEFRILGTDIETKAIASLGGPFSDLPQARGSISAILKGQDVSNLDFFETAAGTVKMRLSSGIIPGLNVNQIIQSLRKGGFFPLKLEPPSFLAFSEINAEANLAQGTLQFDPLKIGLDKASMTLTGAYAVKDQSLALSGTIDLEADHPEASNGKESLKVFFGGNRHAPLMSGLKRNP